MLLTHTLTRFTLDGGYDCPLGHVLPLLVCYRLA